MKPRLAVFELHHLGDAVLALPFLRAARKRFEPLLICRPNVAAFLAEALPNVPSHAVSDFWPARFDYVRRQLRLGPRDAVACVWADPRVQTLMAVSGAGIRAGFAVNARNVLAPAIPRRARRLAAGKLFSRALETVLRRPLLTPPLDKKNPSQHQLESWCQLANSLGFAPDESLPWIESVGERRQRNSPPVFIVHAGGRLPTKRWPVDRFEQVLREFFAPRGIPVRIVAAPGEPFPRPFASNQIVVATPSFRELIEVIDAADAVLANDSFPAHLAAALGKPVVTIFGSGEPGWFAPFGNARNALTTSACAHRPCIDHCVMPRLICLESISTAAVCSALQRVALRMR